ncbi:hypothetical protein BDZ97DRAFT_424181 [Flammula alnicola]|nr:hypothetical protein BDZ97DRAFT_424181 [Flammula alnicola]
MRGIEGFCVLLLFVFVSSWALWASVNVPSVLNFSLSFISWAYGQFDYCHHVGERKFSNVMLSFPGSCLFVLSTLRQRVLCQGSFMRREPNFHDDIKCEYICLYCLHTYVRPVSLLLVSFYLLIICHPSNMTSLNINILFSPRKDRWLAVLPLAS